MDRRHVCDFFRIYLFVSSPKALISNFISVQPPEGKDSYLGFEEHDLEGYLMAIEERWFVLCSWIENRSDVLNQVLKVWSQFEDDKKSLISWLDVVERGLKKMEQSPTEEKRQLLGQAQQITVSLWISHSLTH